ncbi:Uncharacterised protein [uncultured Roseburia sp.]|uniref:Uncharacterized protein n=1 Tax=Brotonthovivens ammoniilytica TaxID=2981725 RepID=A0ABT2TID0_9FIRM|nr:hypothetical protein [Brotonthovivens ammoniilytica]MCU6761862.1 hypothetical protein [Brotonthovivens ammoniilytica]SCI48869.1 Uncharacterised protein [uncultured Roseburia sp.]
MSPQDKVERVLKAIHVTFSKSESLEQHPDKVIIDRKQFLALLDQLNQGLFEMMDQYEHTRASRDRAEREFKHRGKALMDEASEKADDIYAASVLYTADMLGKVQALIDQANDSMTDVFRSFKKELREQKDLVKSHELELEGQLNDLTDTRTYQKLLEDVRRQNRMKDSQEREENGPASDTGKMRERTYTPGVSPEIKINGDYFEKAGISPEDAKAGYVPPSEEPAAEKPEIKINFDAEYFKRKADARQEEPALDEPGEAQKTEKPQEEGVQEVQPEEEVYTVDEEAIRRAVLEDERRAQQEAEGSREAVPGWKSRLKDLMKELVPKDLE